MDHPRAPEDRAIGVDDRRRVVGRAAVALEEVRDDDDPELARERGERLGRRPGNGLRQRADVTLGGPLRIERRERQLREQHELRPISSRRACRLEAAPHVGPQI